MCNQIASTTFVEYISVLLVLYMLKNFKPQNFSTQEENRMKGTFSLKINNAVTGAVFPAGFHDIYQVSQRERKEQLYVVVLVVSNISIRNNPRKTFAFKEQSFVSLERYLRCNHVVFRINKIDVTGTAILTIQQQSMQYIYSQQKVV